MAVAEKIHTHMKVGATKSVPANVVTITPKMAEEMLGKNTRNRTVSYKTVDAYARDIAAGDWKFTGEAIKIAADGSLLDGQHRLLACVQAERPFVTLLVCDIEADAQDLMDTGRGRTVADVLTIAGHANATRIASACRYLNIVKSGAGYSRQKITHAEQLNMLRRHPGIEESAKLVSASYGMSPGLLTCIHYIGAKLLDNEPFANEFVTIFITGNSYDGCAAHTWRERLMRLKAAKTPITNGAMYNGSIHAWNLFSSSTIVKMIRVPDSAEFDGLDLEKI